MKTLLLFAAAAGLTLVSAAPPPAGIDEPAASAGYPPCSATVTDRCIQLYERGVRSAANLARNVEGAPRTVVAQGGPYEPESTAVMAGGDLPFCSASVTDKCMQRAARAARRSAERSHRAAGERG